MGPAYFPTVLGGMLAVLGAVVLFRGFVSKISNPLAVFPFRFWLVVGGLILGVIAYYTQPQRDAIMFAQIAHALLAGVAMTVRCGSTFSSSSGAPIVWDPFGRTPRVFCGSVSVAADHGGARPRAQLCSFGILGSIVRPRLGVADERLAESLGVRRWNSFTVSP